MKLLVTFALLSLAAVVMSDKGIVPGGHPWYPDRWQDVSGVCPAGEGYAVQRAEKGGGKFCTREFFVVFFYKYYFCNYFFIVNLCNRFFYSKINLKIHFFAGKIQGAS